MNYITNFKDCVDWMLKCYPNEGAGIVTTGNKFIAIENTAEDKLNTFSFCAKTIFESYKVKAIIHSHTYDPNNIELCRTMLDPRIPSKPDMEGQIESCLIASEIYNEPTNIEWGIVICEGENVTEPIWFGDFDHRPPLMDREFIHSIQDCVEYMKDWYYKEYKLKLPAFPRTPNWFEEGLAHFDDEFTAWGFVDVTGEPQQRGDLLFYQIRSKTPNHIGVVVEPNLVTHHLLGKFPVIEPYSVWARYNVRQIRHKINITAK